jgi:hypothetical protein
MRVFICIFFLLNVTVSSFGQTLTPKQIKKKMKEGEVMVLSSDYFNALQLFKEILRSDPKHEKVNFFAMLSGLQLGYQVDSIKSYIPVVETYQHLEAPYYLGLAYHKQKNFNKALDYLTIYLKTPHSKREMTDGEVSYMIEACNSAKTIMEKPHRSIITNLGAEVNSSYSDFVPVITADENIMYFTSRREGSSNNVKDAYGNYHEDIYVSYRKDGKWLAPKNAGEPFNTETNDACVALSPDAQRMIVYRTDPSNIATGHLYVTVRNLDDNWGPLQKYGNEINSDHIETSACFSNDTSEIYFSSNRPGGFGGKDIYRIKKVPDGRWGMPFNLGIMVNTPYDEDAPFLHPDGTTLYFSSKGHNTMGDYDIFRTNVKTDVGEFSRAENMGYPLNTVYSDIFFVLSGDGKHGYYSSIKDDTKGSTDIYMADMRFGDNDLLVKHAIIYKDDVPGKAKITLLDNDDKQISGVYNSNSRTGKFILVMNPLKSYRAIVEEPGYNPVVMEIDPMAFEKEESELVIKLTKK